MNSIGVVGAGTMGAGIAHLFALKGFSVTLVDKEKTLLEKALERIEKRTEKEKLGNLFDRLKTTTLIESLGPCDLVIEAVYEEESVKKEVLGQVSRIAHERAIIATNTSSISINNLAEAIDKPNRFLGMHFMNPPVRMKLVEVIRGNKTGEEIVKVIGALVQALGKTPAIVRDSPGFVSNRLLFALIGESLRLLEKGIAQKEDIDKIMQYGMNHPMGPITLADFIGLDVCLDIMEYLYRHLGEESFRPPANLKKKVEAGKLGRKSGEGFYCYHN